MNAVFHFVDDENAVLAVRERKRYAEQTLRARRPKRFRGIGTDELSSLATVRRPCDRSDLERSPMTAMRSSFPPATSRSVSVTNSSAGVSVTSSQRRDTSSLSSNPGPRDSSGIGFGQVSGLRDRSIFDIWYVRNRDRGCPTQPKGIVRLYLPADTRSAFRTRSSEKRSGSVSASTSFRERLWGAGRAAIRIVDGPSLALPGSWS